MYCKYFMGFWDIQYDIHSINSLPVFLILPTWYIWYCHSIHRLVTNMNTNSKICKPWYEALLQHNNNKKSFYLNSSGLFINLFSRLHNALSHFIASVHERMLQFDEWKLSMQGKLKEWSDDRIKLGWRWYE